MSPEEIDAFLGSPDSTWLLRLGVLKEDGWPFVTPMWYQWRDGSFFVVGRKRSAWVQDLIRDPRCLRLHRRAGDAARRRAAQGALHAAPPPWSRGRSWPRARNGSRSPHEMAGRYNGPEGQEGLKLSYGWERYLVRLDPVEGGMTTWQGVGWAKRYLDPEQQKQLEALMADMASASS